MQISGSSMMPLAEPDKFFELNKFMDMAKPQELNPLDKPQRQTIQDMATEFESLMTSQLLKQMRATTGEGGLFPGDDSDTLGGMFDMVFGQYIAENGGLGIAEHLEPHMPKAKDSKKSGVRDSTELLKMQDVPPDIRKLW